MNSQSNFVVIQIRRLPNAEAAESRNTKVPITNATASTAEITNTG